VPDLGRAIVLAIPGMDAVEIRRDLLYRSGPIDLTMDVYAPSRAAGPLLPTIFFVHGGPIREELSPKDWGSFASYGRLAAAAGFVGVTFNFTYFATTSLASAVDDVSAAIDAVIGRAAELRVDRDRLGVWIFSGAGRLLEGILASNAGAIRGAVAFYPIFDDGEQATTPDPEMVGFRGATARADLAIVPTLVARAGLDRVEINASISRWVERALRANEPIDLLNHATGRHGFDVLDDDERSREIIDRALSFMRVQLAAVDERSSMPSE
jgi:acetyl esterase/lipase